MSVQPVSPAEVRRQIWESLGSMVRVYAHAASLNGDEYRVTGEDEALRVMRTDAMLQISFSAEDGTGSWRLEQPGHHVTGTFQIDEAGQLIFPESVKELDEAAIHWVQQLGQPGCAV